MKYQNAPLIRVFELLGNLPTQELVLIGLAHFTAIAGGNIVFLAYCRRTGRRWRSIYTLEGMIPRFNRKEWAWMLLVVAASGSFVAAAVACT